MGVCCIVFDIDGMLFEFFMNFFNIEKFKKKISSKFHVFFAFHAISNIKKKIVSKIFRGGGGCSGGGGGGVFKNNSFSFHVLYYFQH